MSVVSNQNKVSKEQLSSKDSSVLLNKCRQLILTYNLNKTEIQRKLKISGTNITEETLKFMDMQNKFVVTIFGMLELLNDSDKTKLIETLEAFELTEEINSITERIKKYMYELSK